MKKLLKVVVVLVVLVVLVVGIGIGVVFSRINRIAKNLIEQESTRALGVETTLGNIDIGIMSGTVDIDNFRVDNPAGYDADYFLTLADGGVSVSYQSLKQEVVELPELRLEDIDVALQKKGGKANYDVILENVRKSQGEPEPAPTTEEGKRFVINRLTITDVLIDVDLSGLPSGLPGGINEYTRVKIPIEKIELDNVGRTGEGVHGTGVTMKELATIIVNAVLAAAAEKGVDVLPAEILGDLKAQLAQVEALPMKVVGSAKAILEGAGKGVGDALKSGDPDAVKDAVEDVADEVKKGVKDLIPGKKKEEEKK